MVYVRTDGRPVTTPELTQQFEVDRTVCSGQRSSTAVQAPYDYHAGLGFQIADSIERSGNLDNVMRGCMAQRGYLLRPEASPVVTAYPAYGTPAPSAPATDPAIAVPGPVYGRATPPVNRPGQTPTYADRYSGTPSFAGQDVVGY